jgi:hypothetical protein
MNRRTRTVGRNNNAVPTPQLPGPQQARPPSPNPILQPDVTDESDDDFALTPALVQNKTINYTSSDGAKIYKNGSSKLPVEIDCTPAKLRDVLVAVADRARAFGWDENILKINGKSLTTDYGQIDLSQIKTHVETYINRRTRKSQDSMMLYQCLKDSLTDEARATINLHESEYNVNGQPSGPLLLKVIVRESHNDTNATVKFIRERLSSLDTYMTTVDSDITKFNQHVQSNIIALHARGETTHDLLSNLFKGYAAASDRAFVAYIAKKEDEYEEGTNIEPKKLMQLALNKYNTLKEAGKWKAPSDEESKILALTAELNKLKKKSGNSSKGTKKKDVTSNNKKTERLPKPKWMSEPPKSGDPKTKIVDKKTYHWCPKHESWTRHHPSECQGKGHTSEKKRKSDNDQDQSKDSSKSDNKKVKLVQALTAMHVGNDDDSE